MKRKGGRRIIGVMLAGVILIALGRGGQLQAVAGRTLAPIGRVFWAAGDGVAGFFEFLPAIKDLGTRNAQLEHEVSELKQRLAEDAQLRTQNETLKRQLGFNEIQPRKLVPAEIIAYQPDNFRSFLTINRGTRDGVKNGMTVISEGSLVGRITEATATSAKVFLVVDPDFKVGAMNQTGDSRATGTVRGQIGRGLVMEKIPQDQVIKVGDTIATSGLGGDVPKGLLIGQVESVSSGTNAVFQTAQLSTAIKFNQLELLFVITDGS